MADGAASDVGGRARPRPVLCLAGRLFQTRHCARCRFDDEELTLDSEPGSDGFDIPGLHTVDRLGTLLAPVAGEFTLAANAGLSARAKFDAAGLFVEAGTHRLKFGVEAYGEGRKIVSVHSAPYSDEANGIDVGEAPVRLFVSRSADVFSCYLRTPAGRIVFHRAFHVAGCPGEVQAGFFVQSPFSDGSAGRFADIALAAGAMAHLRE